MTEVIGRRERKKAQTRQALADAALELFLERGYDEVGVKDVADAADVSVTTLFKYFPSKEALLFDQEDDIEAALVLAVRGRPPGHTIVDALREHMLRDSADGGPSDEFVRGPGAVRAGVAGADRGCGGPPPGGGGDLRQPGPRLAHEVGRPGAPATGAEAASPAGARRRLAQDPANPRGARKAT
jgi:AcrR family transcriptional regulator